MNPFSQYKTLFELIAFAALLAAIALAVHKFLDYEQNIGYQKAVAEYQSQLVAAQQAAIEKQNQMAAQLKEAQDAYAKQQDIIKVNSSTTATAATSLRDTLRDLRNGMSGATADALRRSVVALSTVSGDCTERYRTVAENADSATAAVITLQKAWPK